MINTSSSSPSKSDCTGLIPGNPNSAETFDTYNDIYEFTGSPHNDMPPPKTAKPSVAYKAPDDCTRDSLRGEYTNGNSDITSPDRV